MIIGAHVIFHSENADRDLFKDVLNLRNVDADEGRGIFASPVLPSGVTLGLHRPRHVRP